MVEAGAWSVGEFLSPAAQDIADPEQRVTAPTPATGAFLLDAAADLVDRGGAELDDTEGV